MDFFYEGGQFVFLQARSADDDLLDAGVPDDLGSLVDGAVEQEPLAHEARYRGVVDDAQDVVAVAEVVVEESQDVLGGVAGSDEDDRYVEQVEFLQQYAGDDAHGVDEQEHQEEVEHEK